MSTAALAGGTFGPGHPLAPIRVELAVELAQAFGVFRYDGVEIVPSELARPEQLDAAEFGGQPPYHLPPPPVFDAGLGGLPDAAGGRQLGAARSRLAHLGIGPCGYRSDGWR